MSAGSEVQVSAVAVSPAVLTQFTNAARNGCGTLSDPQFGRQECRLCHLQKC